VVISAPTRHWLKGAKLFQEPLLLTDRYRHARDRIQHRMEVEDLIKPWLNSHRKHDIFQLGQEHGLAFAYLADLEEAISSPQHRSREFFKDIEHPIVGRHGYSDAPFKLSLTPWRSFRSPLLGEHNAEILGGVLGYTDQEIVQFHEEKII
jgi:formyl-CoA transferase